MKAALTFIGLIFSIPFQHQTTDGGQARECARPVSRSRRHPQNKNRIQAYIRRTIRTEFLLAGECTADYDHRGAVPHDVRRTISRQLCEIVQSYDRVLSEEHIIQRVYVIPSFRRLPESIFKGHSIWCDQPEVRRRTLADAQVRTSDEGRASVV